MRSTARSAPMAMAAGRKWATSATTRRARPESATRAPRPPMGIARVPAPGVRRAVLPTRSSRRVRAGAYTYPYDDVAMASGTEIVCCVGPDCEQKKGLKKGMDVGNCESGDVAVRKDPCTPCPGTGSCTAGASKRGLALEEVLENAVVAEKEKRTEGKGKVHLRRHRHHHGAAGGLGHKH